MKIYTSYRSYKGSAARGDSTWHAHQVNKLSFLNDDLALDPRKALFRDLSESITKDHKKGTNVIVLIDANSGLNDKDILRFLEETNLIDLNKHFHEDDDFPTFIRGSQTLDYVLFFPQILMSIKSYVILH